MEPWLLEYQRFDTIVQQIFKYIASNDYSKDMERIFQTRLMNAHMQLGAALFSDTDGQEKWKVAIYHAVTGIYSVVRDTLHSDSVLKNDGQKR